MELDHVFSCPGTLKKLRSDPLGMLLDGFYRPWDIRRIPILKDFYVNCCENQTPIMNHCTVNQAFRRLLHQCKIPHSEPAAPQIHDLRHTFAVHRLLAWYRDGKDVNARLPWLATYM